MCIRRRACSSLADLNSVAMLALLIDSLVGTTGVAGAASFALACAGALDSSVVGKQRLRMSSSRFSTSPTGVGARTLPSPLCAYSESDMIR